MGLNDWLLLFTALVSLILGLFVYSQGRHKLANIYLTLLSLSMTLWCFGQFMGGVVQGKELVLFWTRLNLVGAIFIPVYYLNFILAFTEEPIRHKRLVWVSYVAAAIFSLIDLTRYFVADVAPRFAYRFYPVPGVAYPLFAFYVLLFFVLGFIKLIGFIRGSQGAKNNQAKYILLASIIGFAGGATAFLPVFNIDFPVLSNFSLPLYLLITVYVIVKHKLLDIELVIRQGLIYSVLAVLFTAFYALVILLANNVFKNLTRWNEMMTTLLVVFASVLIFQPLREQIQLWLDRYFFRGKYYYQKTISDLSADNLQLYRSLIQSDKLAALGTIAAGMAHEIKNPLAAIKGLTQILPENLNDQDFIKKYQTIVPRQLDRINRIVEDLLDFGHPKELLTQKVEVAKVMDEVLRLVETQCRQADVAIVKKYDPVPTVLADPEKLAQAFMNIILNAVQAMPTGGELTVAVYKAVGQAAPSPVLNVIVEIIDTGSGIPEEKLSKIFDPFYTTKESGSGMGLAVTYKIIQEHQGSLEVDSQMGCGTKFRISLKQERDA